MPLHTSDALGHLFRLMNDSKEHTQNVQVSVFKCSCFQIQLPAFSPLIERLHSLTPELHVCLSRSREGLWILRRACVFLCFIPENKTWTVWDACIHCTELNLKFLDFQRTFSYVDWHSTSGNSKTWSFSCCRTCPVFLFQIFLIGSFKFRFFLKKY